MASMSSVSPSGWGGSATGSGTNEPLPSGSAGPVISSKLSSCAPPPRLEASRARAWSTRIRRMTLEAKAKKCARSRQSMER